jgi:two-component system, NtrC family, sensor kinase
LTRNMVFVMIILSFTPLIIMTGAIGYYFDVSYRAKALDHLNVLIRKHQKNIDTFLSQRLADIRVFAKTYSFDQLKSESFLKERLALMQEEFGGSIVDLGVVDDRGIQIAYAGPYKLKHFNYSETDWFRQAIKREEFVSDVGHGQRSQSHFIVAIKRDDAGKSWILRATVDFGALDSIIENVRIGHTGFAFVVNRKGEFQIKPRSEGAPSLIPYLSYLEKHPGTNDEIGFMENADDSGVKFLNVLALLKNGEWLLVFRQNASDAYSVLHHAQGLAIGILITCGIGIFTGAVLLSRRMVAHIAKADDAKEVMNDQVIEAGKLAALGELSSGIAHEINNPVAIMVEEAGWIEDLLHEDEFQDSQNLEEFKRALHQIRTQGKRCKEITRKLLSFARKTDPSVQDVQLNDVIGDVVGLWEQRAKYSNVEISTHLDPELPTVNVAPSELQQVLLNLVNNAVDAMETKGGTINVSSRFDGDCVVAEVTDNGPGITKANLPRIFDPFFTTKPVGKGTGLGLSICYGIVKKMGGEIVVTSTEGQGATFLVHIPMPRDKAPTSC